MSKNKNFAKKWIDACLEIFKWGVVIWLLIPIKHASQSPISFFRVTMGIALFIIFSGKIFYDIVIQNLIRKRRDNLRNDIITLVAIVVIIAFVVGFLIFFIGLYVVEAFKMVNHN